MKDYIKSPLNYTGGKHKLLPQITPLFPENINTFIDLFGGGFNVGINVNSNKVIYNDIERHIVEWLNYIKYKSIDEIISEIENNINKYNLNRENKEGYLQLRNDYNKNKTPDLFFTLAAHSFSNQIRYNKKGEFNLPFGKRTFNDRMKDNLIKFHNELIHKDLKIMNIDFRKFNIESLMKDDFIYIDPPYLITFATYNENGAWNENDEKDLYEFCDDLNFKGIKFALSNVTIHKGKQNEILINWSKKYNIHNLDFDYSNCNYHTKDRNKDSTQEVLITNY